jgi:integrase
MSRRGNGEGTVSQRKDGRWEGRAYVLLPDGGRARRTVYGKTRAEAVENLNKLLDQVRNGVVTPKAGTTVGEYLEQWLDEVARRKLRPRTYDNYEMVVRRHLVPGLGQRKLARLSAADVRRLLNKKADEGLAPATVKKIHVVLGSALQQALRDDVLVRNVARLVEVPTPPGPPLRPYNVDEAQQLLSAAHGDRLYGFWALAVGVGLRRSELLGLRWADVDLDEATLRVEQTLQRSKRKGLELGETKTPRSRRTVPIPDICVRALTIHRARQETDRLAAGSKWQDSGLVFTTSIGTPLEPRNVNRSWHRLCDRAGLRRIRPHGLRHTCATLLLAQGVPARTVMEILGHSQIGVTMNTYTHVSPELLREAAGRMNEALGGPLSSELVVNELENEERGHRSDP